MLDFGNTKEEVKTPGIRISPGIHHVKIKSIELTEWKDKLDNVNKKGVILFECIKTLEGTDSVGKEMPFDLMWPRVVPTPTEEDKKKVENFQKRLMHMFNKCAGSAKVEAVTSYINKLRVSNIDELVAELKKNFEGKEINILVIATDGKDGKQYPNIPLFTSGVCECADVEKTSLKFDPVKQGYKKQDASKVEKPSSTTDDDIPDFLK
jgi:hypothetical protein